MHISGNLNRLPRAVRSVSDLKTPESCKFIKIIMLQTLLFPHFGPQGKRNGFKNKRTQPPGHVHVQADSDVAHFLSLDVCLLVLVGAA